MPLSLLYRKVLPPLSLQVLPQLFILTHLIRKPFPRRYKLPQLPADHLIRYQQLLVDLPIVDRESVAHELGQYGGCSSLRADGRCLSGGGGWEGEAVGLDCG